MISGEVYDEDGNATDLGRNGCAAVAELHAELIEELLCTLTRNKFSFCLLQAIIQRIIKQQIKLRLQTSNQLLLLLQHRHALAILMFILLLLLQIVLCLTDLSL